MAVGNNTQIRPNNQIQDITGGMDKLNDFTSKNLLNKNKIVGGGANTNTGGVDINTNLLDKTRIRPNNQLTQNIPLNKDWGSGPMVPGLEGGGDPRQAGGGMGPDWLRYPQTGFPPKPWDLGPNTKIEGVPGSGGIMENVTPDQVVTNQQNVSALPNQIMKMPSDEVFRSESIVETPTEIMKMPEDRVIESQSIIHDTPPPNDQANIESQEDQLTKQMRLRTERENVLNMQKSLRDAHSRAVREGYPPGSQQYEQIMRNAQTDASNQNITATNKFREFATQRDDEMHDRDIRDFETFSKYIESDVGQSMVAAVAADGGDWNKAMQSLYEMKDGRRVLKAMYQDKNKAELIRTTFEVAAGDLTGKSEAEQSAWVDDKMNKWADQFAGGLDITGDVKDDKATIKQRGVDAIASGDYSNMMSGDFDQLSEEDKGKVQANAFVLAENDPSTPWGKNDYMSEDDAISGFKSSNPGLAIGKVVKFKGELYIVSRYDTADTKSEYWQGRKKVRVWAKPINGGTEKHIESSGKYDDD